MEEEKYNPNDCACGGTLAVPAHPDSDSESGYDPCPECMKHLPHAVGHFGECRWCGMFEPDGACPSLDHPALRKAAA